MKIEELTNEQIAKAQACTTKEERLAFLSEYEIEIPDGVLDETIGGMYFGNPYASMECKSPKNPQDEHIFKYTGLKQPGKIFGNLWPNYLVRCIYCDEPFWSTI